MVRDADGVVQALRPHHAMPHPPAAERRAVPTPPGEGKPACPSLRRSWQTIARSPRDRASLHPADAATSHPADAAPCYPEPPVPPSPARPPPNRQSLPPCRTPGRHPRCCATITMRMARRSGYPPAPRIRCPHSPVCGASRPAAPRSQCACATPTATPAAHPPSTDSWLATRRHTSSSSLTGQQPSGGELSRQAKGSSGNFVQLRGGGGVLLLFVPCASDIPSKAQQGVDLYVGHRHGWRIWRPR